MGVLHEDTSGIREEVRRHYHFITIGFPYVALYINTLHWKAVCRRRAQICAYTN